MAESTSLQVSHIRRIPPVTSNHYPYLPLDPSRDEIRLIHKSEPFEVEEMINCTLHHVSLHQNPVYEALSYTWGDRNGDSHLRHNIRVNGHVVSVTKNLELALRQLFSVDQSKVLWIDALCID